MKDVHTTAILRGQLHIINLVITKRLVDMFSTKDWLDVIGVLYPNLYVRLVRVSCHNISLHLIRSVLTHSQASDCSVTTIHLRRQIAATVQIGLVRM